MGLLKFAIGKKKKSLEIPEEAKEIMDNLENAIVEGYAFNLATKILAFTFEIGLIADSPELRDLEKFVAECPEALHYVYANGDNVINYAFKQRKLGAIFLAVQNLQLMNHFTEVHGAEKEPLCFSILKSKNLKIMQEMNNFIEKNKLKPQNEQGESWKDLFQSTYSKVKKEETERREQFLQNIHEMNNNIRDFGKEVKD